MEHETINQGLGYLALGIASWPICKYVIKPIIDTFTRNPGERMIQSYEKAMNKTLEERRKMSLELIKDGKSKEEISSHLESALPVDFKFSYKER